MRARTHARAHTHPLSPSICLPLPQCVTVLNTHTQTHTPTHTLKVENDLVHVNGGSNETSPYHVRIVSHPCLQPSFLIPPPVPSSALQFVQH